MGTWETGIFSDDFASDLREEYKDKISLGKSSKEATEELMTEYQDELNDHDESSVFWIALASTQLTLGRLQENVKSKALQVIESGQDLQRWIENSRDYNKRRAILEKLKIQIQTDQPTPKKIGVRFIRNTSLEIGDLLTYKHSSGNIAVLRVLNIKQEKCGDRYPQIEVLNHFSSSLPLVNNIKTLSRKRVMPETNDSLANMFKSLDTYYVAEYGKRDKEPWDKFDIIEKKTKSLNNIKGTVGLTWWKEFDNLLTELFEK